MTFLLAFVMLSGLVALAVSAPLRAPAASARHDREARRAELEAAREVKYRELREAQLDFRMGKVSAADHRETERELRAQAIEILRRLDELDDA
jgi:hypothetical protein